MVASTSNSISTILFFLLTLFSIQPTSFALAQASTTTTQVPIPTAAPNPAPATPPPSNLPFIIIDPQWTQLFIGIGLLLLSIVSLAGLYGFIWVPWWRAKMAEAEKVYNKMEKERLAGKGPGGRA